MNQIRNTIFYRMYLYQPNYFLNHVIKNNQRFYTERFKMNNISGIFNYHKLIYTKDIDKDDKFYTIISNIGINDHVNKIKYVEHYEFKKFDDVYTELYEFGIYKTNNFICNYKPLQFNDLPSHIKNFIYMKNDEDIIKN